MHPIHRGGCHCGQLRYQFGAPLNDIAHCHCSDCRRTTGGILTTWLTVPLASFQWLSGTPHSYASTATCLRSFCPNCGAQLTLFSQLSPHSLDISVATLDHPEQAPADRHIWVQSRLSWLQVDPQLPEEAQEQIL